MTSLNWQNKNFGLANYDLLILKTLTTQGLWNIIFKASKLLLQTRKMTSFNFKKLRLLSQVSQLALKI